ncbi:MAG: double-strand break repair protein AddB, partial [Sneathiellales bacterium]|nr:double-strand break repair protein AddB [Sneathiellales bacterium]
MAACGNGRSYSKSRTEITRAVTEDHQDQTPLRPKVFNIPPDMSFVDCLAKEILRLHGRSLEELGRVTILTTTRRAARALQNAFLRETGGEPLLLPRMRPLGDVDEDDLLLEGDQEFLGAGDGRLDLPPAIDGLRRQLLLSRLIERQQGEKVDFAQCAGLAKELCRLLDQVQTEGLDFADLHQLVPAEYAEHWQITLEFLKLVSEVWPVLLEAEGCMDPAHRRDSLIRAQTEEWRQNPPEGPLYAVGSTGSIPATADLLTVIATLPEGAVILPGLDRHLDDKSWDLVLEEPGHPQFGLAKLLQKMDLKRDQVEDIFNEETRSCSPERPRFLANMLRPAETTDRWQLLEKPPGDVFEGLYQLTCSQSQSEALTIALLMRETLETPQKTAVLITPDRDLSRRVSAELKRWDIEVDDSAGSSLDQSPPGVFLRLVARMIADRFAPVSILATLKHPYATMGMERAAFREHVRELERLALRGPRPAPGLDGIKEILQHSEASTDLQNWFDLFSELAGDHAALMSPAPLRFEALVHSFIGFAEKLSLEQETGQSVLWKGHFGEAAADFIAELLRSSDVMEELSSSIWPDLMDTLMSGRMVRARYGLHPRLQIWGPIEGRLQRADRVILGGLNEGIWPPDPGSDPWMSRPMRQEFTLPSPEKKIGLSAHDFQQAICAKEVYLTRSEKVDGTPMVPSRWILRLETLLKKFATSLENDRTRTLLDWQEKLDRPAAYLPVSAPRPTPPLSARPRRLSVTRIEKWLKDPYSIFADAILKLKPLAQIGEDPGAAEKGTFIHAALEKFVKEYPDSLPPDALDRLLSIGRETFSDVLSYPAVWAFWWPRFERIATWFIAFEKERRMLFTPAA